MFLKDKFFKQNNRTEEARQLVINYKRFFNTEEGKAVFRDLFNTFMSTSRPPKDITDGEVNRQRGRSDVIWHIVGNRDQNLDDFERTLRGEL